MIYSKVNYFNFISLKLSNKRSCFLSKQINRKLLLSFLDSNKTPSVAKPIIPTIFLEDKEVDEETFVQVNHNRLKDDFNAKVNTFERFFRFWEVNIQLLDFN